MSVLEPISESSIAVRQNCSTRNWGWYTLLISWLLLVPQLSFYVGYIQATWPFGNAIAGTDELRIVFGLAGVTAGLSLFSGFFFFVFWFLIKAVWWKRLLILAAFLALHFAVTFAVEAASMLVLDSMISANPGWTGASGDILDDGYYYLGPFVGGVAVLLAVIVQVLLGWQIIERSNHASRSQVSLARLFEGVAVCTLVIAAAYSLSGLDSGTKIHIGVEAFGALLVLSGMSLTSLGVMWLTMTEASVFKKCCALIAVLFCPFALYALMIGAGYWITSWNMGPQDASLMGLACALACFVAGICLTVCWWLARQTGYLLLTKQIPSGKKRSRSNKVAISV